MKQMPLMTDGTHTAIPLERYILGACLVDYEAYSKICSLLRTDMFYEELHKGVWDAMGVLFNNGLNIDLISVTHEMFKQKSDRWKYSNLGYEIAILTKDTISSANLTQWAYMLIEIWQNRETFLIQNGYYVGNTPEETRELISERLFNLAINRTSDWDDCSKIAIALLDELDKMSKSGNSGVKLGLTFFDNVTKGGAKGSQLIVVGARPGVGKSALINLWANNAAKQGKTVGIINLEMRNINSYARMISMEYDIDYSDVMSSYSKGEEERNMLVGHITSMANLPIYFTSSSDMNITDIRAKATQLHKRANLGILFIDYLQLIEPSKSGGNINREQQVAQMSRGCKLLAKQLDIPVVILAQLNRESTKSADKRPQITQLRESGAIEQDADIVMLLHRDIDEEGQVESGTENEAWIKVAKHRDGKTTPYVKVGYDGPKMKFYDVDQFEPLPINYMNSTLDKDNLPKLRSLPPTIPPPNDILPF